MTTLDFITELFCQVDDAMRGVPKHPQASLYPSELVTVGMLFAIQGVGERAFYRWLTRDYRGLFPHLPERTRLVRRFKAHRAWTDRFLAPPSRLGVADTFGIEWLHPRREGRSPGQLGHQGRSNGRWIIGAKVGVGLNPLGRICAGDCTLARVADKDFRPLVARFADPMVALADPGNTMALKAIAGHTGLRVRPVQAEAQAIRHALQLVYAGGDVPPAATCPRRRRSAHRWGGWSSSAA